jgi:hypothetical protein
MQIQLQKWELSIFLPIISTDTSAVSHHEFRTSRDQTPGQVFVICFQFSSEDSGEYGNIDLHQVAIFLFLSEQLEVVIEW